jgi:hypothetical protein
MQYTILELERIEKVLQAKLFAAKEAYSAREKITGDAFSEKINSTPMEVRGSLPPEDLVRAYKEWKSEDEELVFLAGEMELFQRGIDTLYSYWNYSVEIFIDNLREKEHGQG